MSADDLNRPAEGRDKPQGLRDEIERGHARSASASRGAYVAALDGRAPLSAPRERALVAAAQRGDAAARARLVDAFLPLVAAMARTYRSAQVERVELLQEGVVGLLRALERYDLARGTPFWAYAAWWVRQAMQQLVSELTRPVVLSDRALRGLARLKEAHRAALQADGREPTRHELAARAGLTGQQVDDLLATERAPRSLQEPMSASEGELGTLGELLADPLAEDAYERVLDAAETAGLRELLGGLSDRERGVLHARYGINREERTLREIGEELGVSSERVRQIERRALAKLATDLEAGG